MKYIRIRNASDGVNRLHLEKLGLSTKRDNDNSIGQFGSGAKYAPIAALRNGWRWVFCGRDHNGPYQMEYIVKDEDGIDSVFYEYNNGEYEKASSFTVDAGVLSWNEPFQIFREAFANALDEWTAFSRPYFIDFVDDINPPEDGWFDVYLTNSPEMSDIVENIDSYFLINRKPLLANKDTTIYKAISDDTRFYHKSVYVGEVDVNKDDKYCGLFDWSFNRIDLNEERRIRNYWNLYYWMEYAIYQLVDPDVIKHVLIHMNEFNELSRLTGTQKHPRLTAPLVWIDVWRSIFGETAIPAPPALAERMETFANLRGYTIVPVKNEIIANILESAGVKTLNDLVGGGADFERVKLTESEQKIYDLAYEIVLNYDERIKSFDIDFFSPDENQKQIAGITVFLKNRSTILISNALLASDEISSVVATLIHELDHALYRYDDDDPRFRSVADSRIGAMVTKYFKPTMNINIDDNKILIPIKDLSKIHYKIRSFGEWAIVSFEKILLMVKGDFDNHDGMMHLHGDDTMMIELDNMIEDWEIV